MYRVSQRQFSETRPISPSSSNCYIASYTWGTQRKQQKAHWLSVKPLPVQSLHRQNAGISLWRHLQWLSLEESGKKGKPVSRMQSLRGGVGFASPTENAGAIHNACLTLKLFATVLLNSVEVLLQSGVHAIWSGQLFHLPPVSYEQVGSVVNLPWNVQSVFMYLVSVLLLVF
jgi:hypothetical protein